MDDVGTEDSTAPDRLLRIHRHRAGKTTAVAFPTEALQPVITARDAESALLSRCVQVASADGVTAMDGREANVFRLASMVLASHHPAHARRLHDAAHAHFVHHPEDKLPAGEVVHKGWVFGLPRLRDMLEHALVAA